MSGSCVGCKFLWADGIGYSDYTWIDTDVKCAKERNPNLPTAEPFDWKHEPDNLPATKDARCSEYAQGPYITVSPDGYWNDEPIDDEQKSAISAHREYRKE
jgi:hypothetical protein